ncbi:MAG: hypothetical protein ABFS37_04290 [Acidobacteriota bacterium]
MTTLRVFSMVAVLGLMVVAPAWSAGHVAPLVIPSAAFHNDGDDPEGFWFHPDGYLEGEGAGVKMIAAVYLPSYATVESFTLYAVDGTDSCPIPSVNAWLYRVEISNGDVSMMALTATSGASSAMQERVDSSIAYPVVSNLQYRYFVRVDFCASTHDFYSIAIDYSE